jgi:hypothetical protein
VQIYNFLQKFCAHLQPYGAIPLANTELDALVHHLSQGNKTIQGSSHFVICIYQDNNIKNAAHFSNIYCHTNLEGSTMQEVRLHSSMLVLLKRGSSSLQWYDCVKFRQQFVNLLERARKHSHGHNTVSLCPYKAD